ncbi:hypothetical protein Sjap_023888 [Stephania japonica]|uniref:Uncharacterized protein n=1 Tax=Stephania japonica TaxID=461633 RepID=A0AAP0ECG5_9MAGN
MRRERVGFEEEKKRESVSGKKKRRFAGVGRVIGGIQQQDQEESRNSNWSRRFGGIGLGFGFRVIGVRYRDCRCVHQGLVDMDWLMSSPGIDLYTRRVHLQLVVVGLVDVFTRDCRCVHQGLVDMDWLMSSPGIDLYTRSEWTTLCVGDDVSKVIGAKVLVSGRRGVTRLGEKRRGDVLRAWHVTHGGISFAGAGKLRLLGPIAERHVAAGTQRSRATTCEDLGDSTSTYLEADRAAGERRRLWEMTWR